MSWTTIIWSTELGACLMLLLVHLLVWSQDRHSWADLCFSSTLLSVIGLVTLELIMMSAESPTTFGHALRWAHLVYAIGAVSSLGFVHFYFGTGNQRILGLALGLRFLALVANFTAGESLHVAAIHSLQKVSFFGEQVSMLGEWTPNPWVRLAQIASLVQLIYVIDASVRLWRTGSSKSRRRAVIVGGSLAFFIVFAAGDAALVATGVLRMPFMVSFPFLGMVVAMSYELSRNVLRAARLGGQFRASEAALRESEARVSLAAEAANLVLWGWDISRNEIWMTDKGREWFGLPKSGPLDLAQFLKALHIDDREQVQKAAGRALAEGGQYESEYRVVRPDGKIYWIAGHGRVEFDLNGKPVVMRGVSRDITLRKQSEDALRESEVRFRTMANTAPVMIWVAGIDKLCTFFNKGWLDFTGRPLEEELGNGWAEGVHRDDFQRCLEVYKGSFDARKTFTMEYRLRRHDGKYRWVLDTGTPRFAHDGAFLGYIGSCLDITERKWAEEKFRVAVEASPIGLVLVDSKGQIVLVNNQTEKLFGYSREEMVDKPVEILVPERLRRAHPGHRADFLAAPEARAMGAGRELFARRKDGTEIPVEIGISPIKTEEGTLILSAIVDISARKQAELESQRYRTELSHLGRVALMGEMSASLAHELNQPLAAILSNAGAGQRFIDGGMVTQAELRELFADIRSDGRRASDVVRGIRSMVKKSAVVRQRMNLNDVVKDVVRIVHPDALLRSCEVETSLASNLPAIEGDPIQLRQVLLNLVLNGFDAMRDSPADNRKVEISTKANNGSVHVSVRDHGSGLSEETRARLFDPFFTTKTEGLGMGLAIVRSIVEAHGGVIEAENFEGGGARFHFALLVQPSAEK